MAIDYGKMFAPNSVSEEQERKNYQGGVQRLRTLDRNSPEWYKTALSVYEIGKKRGYAYQDHLPLGFDRNWRGTQISKPDPSTMPDTGIGPDPRYPPPAPPQQPGFQPTGNQPAQQTPPPGAPNGSGTPQTQPPAQQGGYALPAGIKREDAIRKYQETANRIKGLKSGTPEWNKNAQILQVIGSKFGLKWQDNAPGYNPNAQQPAQQNPTQQNPAPTPEQQPPAQQQPTQPAGYQYAPGDEVIVRKGLSGVTMSPEEGKRFQQVLYNDLIPNAASAGERHSLIFKAQTNQTQYGVADGVPRENAWETTKISNPAIIPQNFNAEAYIKANPDVAAAGADPLQHFLDHGIFEDRVFTTDGKKTSEFYDQSGMLKPTPEQGQQPTQGQPGSDSPLTRELLDKAVNNVFGSADPNFHEGSGLYNFQKREGQRGLDQLIAARGLTGSGAEVEANSKLLNQLGAEEAQRERDYGLAKDNLRSSASQFLLGLNSQDQQTAARMMLDYNGQQQGFLQNLLGIGLDANRLNADVDQRNADRALNAADMTARNNLAASSNALNGMIAYINSGYSQSPFDNAMDAAAGIGQNSVGYGNNAAKVQQSQYARPTQYANTGGGGGSYGYSPAGYAPYMPPSQRPSSPNYSVPNMIGIFGNAANNTGYSNAINSVIGGMFGGGSKSSGSMW